jgi:hypothetical protein
MVTIRKQRTHDGYFFEIDDFDNYVDALRQGGIEPPVSHYRVFVSFDDERRMNERCPTWEAEIKQFYKLGASIPAEIVAT